MKAKDWLREIVKYPRGLKSHGRESNKLLKKWIRDHNQNMLLRNVNVVMVDFVSARLCKDLIGLNFFKEE